MTGERTEIAGSVVRQTEAVTRLRTAGPNEVVEATIVIRRPVTQAQKTGHSAVLSSAKTRDEIEKSLSADAGDIATVTDFARRSGLTLKETSPEKRMIRVEGPVHCMNAAFGIQLAYFDGPD